MVRSPWLSACSVSAGDSWSNDDNSFGTTNGRTALDRCSNVRDLFTDPLVEAEGNQTRWQLKYIQWYFSDNVEIDHDGDTNTILQEILATGNGNRSQCILDQDPTKSATFDKYRRSRASAVIRSRFPTTGLPVGFAAIPQPPASAVSA